VKRTTVSILCLLVWAYGLHAAELTMTLPEGSLTIEQAHRITMDNSPTVQQAIARILAANARLGQAQSAWWPTIAAQGQHLESYASMQLDWAPNTRIRGSMHRSSCGVQLTWRLFDGFARRANILAAEWAVEQSQQLLSDTQRLLLEAVSTAFYGAQLARENMGIARQNQQFNRTLETDARTRWAAGSVAEAEMLNFSVRALQAESDFLDAERNFKVACTVLAELMAMPEATLPRDIYPTGSNKTLVRDLPDYEAQVAYALEHRPDLKALTSNILSLREQLRSRRAAYAPKIDLTAGADYLFQGDGGYVDQDEHSSYVGITARWDLFSGGRRGQEVLQARAEIRAAEAQRRQAILTVHSAVRQAIDNAQTAHATFTRQQQAYELTQRIRDHVETSYRTGVASLTRLNEAQTDLVRVAGAAASSRIQYVLALEKLKAETGRILREVN